MALTEEDLQKLPDDGIDPINPGKYKTLLEDLQGNIIKPHGRCHSVHLFVKFTGEQGDAKEWIQDFAQEYVTSALTQAEQSKQYREQKKKIKGCIFYNLFLSVKGYEYFKTKPFKIPGDQPFRFGMKEKSINNFLADPPVEKWDIGLQQEIHALILIAHDDLKDLSDEVERVKQKLSQVGEIVQEEEGFILRNKDGKPSVHFGFVDGISQPLFVKGDIEKALKNSGGFDKWDPRAPLDLVLAKDPNGKTEDSYGSYLVYRKLEQNVKKFREDQKKLAEKLDVDNKLAGALIVGRFDDGTPVVNSNTPLGPTQTNNFNYDEDPQEFGLTPKPTKCPFHAHIRQTNPRGDTGRVESAPDLPQPGTGESQSLYIERKHRIARRARSYGVNDITQEPEEGSGLLFLCFQGNIENQFNFMQSKWANQNNFIAIDVGLDPVIGQPKGEKGNQKWPETWGDPDTKEVEYDFTLWVNMKGGEYFFAPCLSYLRNITQET